MPIWDATGWVPAPQRAGVALWISFLVAIPATGVLFSAIDPIDVQHCLNWPELSRLGAYSIGFLCLWLLTATSALITVFFVYPPPPARDASPPAITHHE